MSDVWVPDKLRERLVVGARVRIRVSPECTFIGSTISHAGNCSGWNHHGHTGLTATITDEPLCYEHPEHGIRVSFDTSLICGCGETFSGMCFAAIELEPLDMEDES